MKRLEFVNVMHIYVVYCLPYNLLCNMHPTFFLHLDITYINVDLYSAA